jgi:hypothetical protein
MRYIPSINIEQATFCPEDYIVTQNALRVVGNIVDSFNSGVHSFNIIGSYGTGKSNFILALEYGLQKGNALITNKGQFNGFNKFRFENIVGDYVSLKNLLAGSLFPTRISENLFDNLEDYKDILVDFINSQLDQVKSYGKGGVFETEPEFYEITVAGKTYKVLIAQSEEDKEQGLQGVEFLEDNEGMLFDYSEEMPEELSF